MLSACLEADRNQESGAAARKILMLAQSNYEVQFPPDSRLSQRVLSPGTPSQSTGIEDGRMPSTLRAGSEHKKPERTGL
jgi:hypothetical protein